MCCRLSDLPLVLDTLVRITYIDGMGPLDVAHKLIAVLETDGEGMEFDALLLFFGLLSASQDEATMRAIASNANPTYIRDLEKRISTLEAKLARVAKDPWESTLVAWLRASMDWRHSTLTLLGVVGAGPDDRNAESRIRAIMVDRLGWRTGLVPSSYSGKRIRGYVRSD